MNELSKILLRTLPFVFIIIALTIRVKKGKLSKDELGLKTPDTKFKAVIWCASFLIFCIATELTLHHFRLLEVKTYEFKILTSSVRILGMVLIAPVAEELLYRGLFLSKLIGFKINKHLSIFLLSILFVVAHSFAFENTLMSKIGIVQTFLDSTFFAYARLNTKSIYTPIIMHMTGNLIATFEMFLL